MSDAFTPSVLCLGGIDPSGGAGLCVDAAVVRAMGLHALPVSTGTAVQSPRALVRVVPADPDLVREQLEMVEASFSVGAVKVGMLGSVNVSRVAADWLRARPRLPVVVDPVLRTSSGGSLGDVSSLLQNLVPLARVLTPNLDEAAALTGLSVANRDEMEAAAHDLRDRGAQWVLVKGGHLPKGEAADYLEGPETSEWLVRPRRPGGPVRGTGCALASALAAGLARGDSVPEAAAHAKARVEHGIAHSVTVGDQRVLHFGSVL